MLRITEVIKLPQAMCRKFRTTFYRTVFSALFTSWNVIIIVEYPKNILFQRMSLHSTLYFIVSAIMIRTIFKEDISTLHWSLTNIDAAESIKESVLYVLGTYKCSELCYLYSFWTINKSIQANNSTVDRLDHFRLSSNYTQSIFQNYVT